ncbi:superoxide dismutase family protein [Campylobacter insulaenigrae]|uniref:superoxide dismutase family protein n=1 Tax=Campylobacter insulaenigrae TaxID=260714 RepID=UPI002153311D|nr:superoxide dismutase family protein [Campylobacter insulaenigrae]MCR6570663.1 superoxide dismutase family protein [Campylobacter insulaenigrae]MCR6572190.1 superoxide dismutase family protein [Campylobacter insulaenigrae]MCR6576560.1 superoxide dismutase family protein [Campylobacter insulaenigrae]MCR6579548.1 superoxide dismutase family protein [Campylobacter insulaenigrae]MCR6581438.1 superoxide dismutase family protein [Campylobacter insulaenigrae]
MKKIIINTLLASSFLVTANIANDDLKMQKDGLVIKMQMLEDANKDIGEIVAVQTKYGVAFYPNLQGLKSGIYGFHIHENADCGANEKGLGMKAGSHWDPDKTKAHSTPWDDKGHKGDLPPLYVDKDGKATNPVLAPKIKNIKELKNHSLMIHFGGDNHSDHPAALGGGGARMACGVIK